MTDRVYDRVERRLAELKQEQEQLRQPRVYEPRQPFFTNESRAAIQAVAGFSLGAVSIAAYFLFNFRY
jgi:hypothetical protein